MGSEDSFFARVLPRIDLHGNDWPGPGDAAVMRSLKNVSSTLAVSQPLRPTRGCDRDVILEYVGPDGSGRPGCRRKLISLDFFASCPVTVPEDAVALACLVAEGISLGALQDGRWLHSAPRTS